MYGEMIAICIRNDIKFVVFGRGRDLISESAVSE